MASGLLRQDLRYAAFWLAGALTLFVVMLATSLNTAMMDAVDEITDDWVVHILGFMVITVSFCGPLQPRYRNWVFVAFAVFGVLIELVQVSIPGRNASLLDLLANIAGLILGWYFLRSKYGDWCLWLETRLGIR